MVKIKEYRITARGGRGFSVTVPKIWVKDMRLLPGDCVEVFRDEADRLILVPKKQHAESA